MDDEMNIISTPMHVIFLCDGNIEKCKADENCYKNGGECKRTRNIVHAKNFNMVAHGAGHIVEYVEEDEK